MTSFVLVYNINTNQNSFHKHLEIRKSIILIKSAVLLNSTMLFANEEKYHNQSTKNGPIDNNHHAKHMVNIESLKLA